MFFFVQVCLVGFHLQQDRSIQLSTRPFQDEVPYGIDREKMLLETESFLTELTRMFQKSKEAGSLVITMKRWDGHDKPTPRDIDKKPPKSEYDLSLNRRCCRAP